MAHKQIIPASREALLPRPAGVAAPEEDAVDLTFSLLRFTRLKRLVSPRMTILCEAPVGVGVLRAMSWW